MPSNHDIDHERLAEAIQDITTKTRGMTVRGEAKLPDADLGAFGIAVLTRDGRMLAEGDADALFPIQSISKVFSLTLALEKHSNDVWKRVGREPSGDPYNSITDLERHEGIPRNPLINAGALVVVDMLLEGVPGDEPPEFVRRRLEEMLETELSVSDEVVRSEEKGYVNRALANLAKSFGNLAHEVDPVMAEYVRQCAIELSCRQLARAGRYLMLEQTRDDLTAREVRRARRLNALMLTCGHYDGSGDFAFRVGLPSKSGVAGAILAIAPNIASIAVWSPGLDENGNSLIGTQALEMLSEKMGWSIFGASGVSLADE
ncbi:MAG TPA: glutaminase A [Saliniramus sp.]|nr:glutaminase A [Saliniramus sp.]